ncbi:hypothetical protein [Xenorhabdus szentirmaii]|uniref:hypothetical protein n=1 Tax=Xenorhabdus szentirmaii TaxID=290112 RepID=UPI002B40413E|nr:hypothetical protein [Xenorhabdus sp. M]
MSKLRQGLRCYDAGMNPVLLITMARGGLSRPVQLPVIRSGVNLRACIALTQAIQAMIPIIVEP